jgi:hypothetical protein
MYCTRCGTANSEELMFCTNCSAPLNKPGESSRAQGSSGSSQNPYSSPSGGAPGFPNPQPPAQPYPGYRSAQPESQSYQPYQSSYAHQMPTQQGSASTRAIASMILSIVSIATCGPILSIPGLIMGKMELNAIRDGQAPKAGETFAKVGFYVGIAATALYCLLGAVWAAILFIGSVGNSF